MMDLQIEFLRWLESIRSDFLTGLFEMITMLAEETIIIFAVVILWFAIDKKIAQKLFFVTIFSMGVNGIIKNFVKMPRPFAGGKVSCVREGTATGYSFPSGHTQNFATWSTLAAVSAKKRVLQIVTAILILLVAFSRMYLGAHYPMDVIVGMILGVSFAILGNKVYDKAQDKNKLFLWSIAFFTPFAVWFAVFPNLLYGDFFKIYGMLIGTYAGIKFEEKFAPVNYDVSVWKKTVRVILGVALALLLKEGLKALLVSDNLVAGLILDGVRYLVLLFIMVGICPLVFKKLKL